MTDKITLTKADAQSICAYVEILEQIAFSTPLFSVDRRKLEKESEEAFDKIRGW